MVIKNKSRHAASLLGLLLFLILAVGSVDDSGSSSSNSSNTKTRKWYEGGTLHQADALTWQDSSYRNKLATCADFIAVSWSDKKLNPKIQNSIKTMDDMRPYAAELVNCLDAALEKQSDPELNRKMYTNQTVAGTAALCTVMMDYNLK